MLAPNQMIHAINLKFVK